MLPSTGNFKGNVKTYTLYSPQTSRIISLKLFFTRLFAARKQPRPCPWPRIAKHRANNDLAHFPSADFDVELRGKEVVRAEFLHRPGANQKRPGAGEPHARVRARQRVRVTPSRGQVLPSLLQIS